MSNKPRSGKPPARRVGKKASNKKGSFSVDLPYPIGPFPKSITYEYSPFVDVDIPDLCDRFKNGNQFEKGARLEGKYFILKIVFA